MDRVLTIAAASALIAGILLGCGQVPQAEPTRASPTMAPAPATSTPVAPSVTDSLQERPPDPEKLLYGLDGDIFLADTDGRNPTRVAEGATLFEGSPWAPDGRHFLSFDTARVTAVIREPDGDEVASLPNKSFAPWWSPDSTRLQAWNLSERQIDIYGIDGVLQAELPLPDRYTRVYEYPGFWAPDGRSVWVWIARDQTYPPCTAFNSGPVTNLDSSPCAAHEVWELPIDGSAPQRVLENLPFVVRFMPSFSRDGTRLAFSGRDGDLANVNGDLATRVYVANADGTEARAVVRSDQGSGSSVGVGMFPSWSPSGQDLAYFVGADLKVVDVASGTSRTLATGWQYAASPPHSWSRDGDRIMFSKQSGPTTQDGLAFGNLWTVGIDGNEATLLVEGATHGAWQP